MSEYQESQKAGDAPKRQASPIKQEDKNGNTSTPKVAGITPQETSLSQTFALLGKNPPDDGFSKSREAMKDYNARNAVQQMSERFSSIVPTSQGAIQRMEDSDMKKKGEEKIQMKKGGQAPTSGGNASSKAMPDAVKGKMESSFGTDFSEVKIHDNSASSTEMGALAYAQGNDIHFAPGQYKPETQTGQELLGHELTHVVQQRQGRVQATTQAKGVAVNDDPALEREADDIGRRVAQGKSAHVKGKSGGIQKKADSGFEYRPMDYATHLRSLNSKIEEQFNDALTQFGRVISLKSTVPDYLKVTVGHLRNEVTAMTSKIPGYGALVVKAFGIFESYYKEHAQSKQNREYNRDSKFQIKLTDMNNEKQKWLNKAVNKAEKMYKEKLKSLSGDENGRKNFMKETYENYKKANDNVIEFGHINMEKGIYKNYLSNIRGSLKIKFKGEWLKPVLESVKIIGSGHDQAIMDRLNLLYKTQGYIPLDEFKMKKEIWMHNNMGGDNIGNLDHNNNPVDGSGKTTIKMMRRYWKKTSIPLKSVKMVNGLPLPIPIKFK